MKLKEIKNLETDLEQFSDEKYQQEIKYNEVVDALKDCHRQIDEKDAEIAHKDELIEELQMKIKSIPSARPSDPDGSLLEMADFLNDLKVDLAKKSDVMTKNI